MDIHKELEYQIIAAFYKGKSARRSRLPMMNHINEGLQILQHIGADEKSCRAFCIHPIFQGSETLAVHGHALAPVIDSTIMMFTMEYRNIANAYLSHHFKGPDDEIELSPLPQVNDMLIADKIQNRKDFEIYHKGVHERSDELEQYFKNWLRVLGITEESYTALKSELGWA